MDLRSLCFGLILLLSANILTEATEDLLSHLSSVFNDATESEEEIDDGPPHYCDSYNKATRHSNIPCKNEELDEFGFCNKTQKCMKGVEQSHCFMSWRNESGKVTIVSSGCWIHHSDDCIEKNECRAHNNSDLSGVYFCCCEGNYCNRKFYLDPASDPDDNGQVTMDEPDTYNQWMILLYVLVPLFVLCCLAILVSYMYCNRKRSLEYMDGVSVDTPATECTMASFSPNPEMSLPQLIDMKARGRFGKVWKAQTHDRFVAVKMFEVPQKLSWQNEQDIFMTPLMNTHDNILKFLSATKRGEGNDIELWLITEFHERGSLLDYLKANTVTMAEALRIMWSMARGMTFLHEDVQSGGENKPAIAHRDFKSKNVLLDQKLNAVVADFGLAVKFTPGESPGESHGQVGTLRYMAPEVLEGAINFQKDSFLRIDMYAFALVMWEILSRCTIVPDVIEAKLPFEPELGTHPSMDDMQEHVVEKKKRPMMKEGWSKIKAVQTICETMEECWDHDAEARLSAGCIELRIAGLKQALKEPTPTEIHNNQLIINPSVPHVDSDTEAMNQLNLQFSNINNGPSPAYPSTGPDKNMIQQMANGLTGYVTTTLSDNEPHQGGQEKKTQDGATYVICDPNDQDSGTYVNEDTLSHDGVMEQLLATDSSDSSVPVVSVVDSDHDSALLMSCERESDL